MLIQVVHTCTIFWCWRQCYCTISEDLHSYCNISIGDVHHQRYSLYFSFSKQAWV